MASRARRRRMTAAAVSLAIIISVVVIGLSVAHHRGGRPVAESVPVPTPNFPAPTAIPTAADVAAARACQAFAVYLVDAQRGAVPAAVGRMLIEDAAVLLRGSTADRAAGRALPTWSALGSELLAAAEDVVSNKTSALRTDGAAVGAECRSVPAAAAAAGGFRRSG